MPVEYYCTKCLSTEIEFTEREMTPVLSLDEWANGDSMIPYIEETATCLKCGYKTAKRRFKQQPIQNWISTKDYTKQP